MNDEVDDWMSAPAPPASDDWTSGRAPQAPQPGYLDTLGRTAKGYADDAGATVSDPFQKDAGPGSELLQRIGDAGGRAASIVGDTAGAVLSPVQAGFSSGLGYLMPELAKKYVGRDLTPEEQERVQKVADDTGQLLTMAVFAPSAGKAGPVRPDPTKPFDKAMMDVGPGMKRLLTDESGAGDPKAIGELKDFMKSETSGGPNVQPTPKNAIAPFESEKVHNSISDLYSANKGKSDTNYAARDEVAETVPYYAKGLRQELGKVIKDIAEDPTSMESGALKHLKPIYEKLNDVGGESSLVDQYGKPLDLRSPDMVTAKDLYDIKQYGNQFFDSKTLKGNTAMSRVMGIVKNGIDDVEAMHPPLGDLTKEAHKYWANNVNPFETNSVLHRFWKPEDYHNLNSVRRGILNELPSVTQERQYKLLSKVKNPVEFEALYNSLPKDSQEAFAAALKTHINDELGIGFGKRMRNIVQGAANTALPNPVTGWHPRAGVNQMLQGIDPNIPPEVADILKAIKGEEYQRGGAIKSVNTNPTPAQKMAGNYKKAHVKFHGLDISIENPKGSVRRGKSADGKEWKSIMPDHYGYIKRTQGADDDHIDVYLGGNERSNRVYVIDQKDFNTGKFDEHKCMLGYSSREAAMSAYRAAFSDQKDRIMKITRLSISEFKDWLKSGDTRQPLKKTA